MKNYKKLLAVISLALAILICLSACASTTPTPTATPEATQTVQPPEQPTVEPTATPTEVPTATPTATPEVTPTPEPTVDPATFINLRENVLQEGELFTFLFDYNEEPPYPIFDGNPVTDKRWADSWSHDIGAYGFSFEMKEPAIVKGFSMSNLCNEEGREWSEDELEDWALTICFVGVNEDGTTDDLYFESYTPETLELLTPVYYIPEEYHKEYAYYEFYILETPMIYENEKLYWIGELNLFTW